MAAEESNGCFDYHAFFVRVVDYLIQIKGVYRQDISTLRQAVGATVDFHLVEMVHEILFDAATYNRFTVKYSLLASFVGGMDDMVQHKGSNLSEVARNHISPVLRFRSIYNKNSGSLIDEGQLPMSGAVDTDAPAIALAGSRLD